MSSFHRKSTGHLNMLPIWDTWLFEKIIKSNGLISTTIINASYYSIIFYPNDLRVSNNAGDLFAGKLNTSRLLARNGSSFPPRLSIFIRNTQRAITSIVKARNSLYAWLIIFFRKLYFVFRKTSCFYAGILTLLHRFSLHYLQVC